MHNTLIDFIIVRAVYKGLKGKRQTGANLDINHKDIIDFNSANKPIDATPTAMLLHGPKIKSKFPRVFI